MPMGYVCIYAHVCVYLACACIKKKDTGGLEPFPYFSEFQLWGRGWQGCPV